MNITKKKILNANNSPRTRLDTGKVTHNEKCQKMQIKFSYSLT